MSILTQQLLKQILDYSAETGAFTWLVDSGKARKGHSAGRLKADGYREIGINGKVYRAHRLAFLWMTGEMPADRVDHINRDPDDNRWTNLRPCSQAENCLNRGARRDGTSRFLGVSRSGSRWRAQLKMKGKKASLGYFDTEEEAHQAYVDAKFGGSPFQPSSDAMRRSS